MYGKLILRSCPFNLSSNSPNPRFPFENFKKCIFPTPLYNIYSLVFMFLFSPTSRGFTMGGRDGCLPISVLHSLQIDPTLIYTFIMEVYFYI